MTWHAHNCPDCARPMPCQPTNRLDGFKRPMNVQVYEACYMLPGQAYHCLDHRKSAKVVYLDRVSGPVLEKIQARREARVKRIATKGMTRPTWLRPPKQKFDFDPILAT